VALALLVVVSSIMLIARVLVLLVPVGIQSLNPPSCSDSSTARDGGSWFLVSSHSNNLINQEELSSKKSACGHTFASLLELEATYFFGFPQSDFPNSTFSFDEHGVD
jgi:hypothetical protein